MKFFNVHPASYLVQAVAYGYQFRRRQIQTEQVIIDAGYNHGVFPST
jgi:hypothetical protein